MTPTGDPVGNGDDAVAYADSSFLIALVAPEDAHHGEAISVAAATSSHWITSAVTEVEVGRALARRHASDAVRAETAELLSRVQLVEVTVQIRQQAVGVRPGSLRSLDAIHIATALAAEVATLATFDARQAVAAEEMGLRLLRP